MGGYVVSDGIQPEMNPEQAATIDVSGIVSAEARALRDSIARRTQANAAKAATEHTQNHVASELRKQVVVGSGQHSHPYLLLPKKSTGGGATGALVNFDFSVGNGVITTYAIPATLIG